MPPLELIDVSLTLGRPNIPKYHAVDNAAVVKEELAEFGIAGGLVRHSFAIEGHPSLGNGILADALKGVAGFEPVWTVMPHWTGEFPAPEEVAREMAANKARAAVMYPARQGFPLRPGVVGPLLDMLEAARVPLMVPHGEADLRTLEELMRSHPALPLVIIEMPHGSAREFYPLFGAFKTLYIDVSSYMVHLGLEELYKRFGVDRLLFGTRYPLYNPGCAVSALMYAGIPDSAKEQIASGNIRRLLGEARPL